METVSKQSKSTWLDTKCHGNSDLCQNSSKTAEGCVSVLMLPIRWCSVNFLHKHARLNWTTTHCRCILKDIGMKLFSLKTSKMAQHFFNVTFIGPLYDRSGSGMMSITSLTLNVHCTRNVIKFLLPGLSGSFRA